MPNTFAYAMLFAWPIVTVILFTRLQAREAVVWSLLGGMLLLPERTAIDLPGVPPFNKLSIASLAALCCALMLGRDRPRLMPRGAVGRVLVLMLVAGPFITALLNGDRLTYGPKVLPGMSTYDALAAIVQAVFMVIPFLMARHYLATPEAHRVLLWAVFLAGLAYSLPILFEVRMSPQLHNIVYGFFPHSWAQQYRFGGFRPVVFTQHGLWLAMFVALVTVAAAALWRMVPPGQPQRQKLGLALVFFLVIAMLCRTVSVWALLLIAVPLVVMTPPRLQVRIAALLIGVVLLYPLLRGADLVPTETLVSAAESISAERAGSLQFRFDNEDRLLAKADRRPIFGWGSWGRNRVYDDFSGSDITVTDGYWIGALGVGGWFGFTATFGLLCLPVLLLWRRSAGGVPPETAGLAVMLTINAVNLIPNATLLPLTWLLAGAIYGHVESLARAPNSARRGRPVRPERPRQRRPGRASEGEPATVGPTVPASRRAGGVTTRASYSRRSAGQGENRD